MEDSQEKVEKNSRNLINIDLDLQSTDRDCCQSNDQHQTSNAFKILMNQGKSVQVSKLVLQDQDLCRNKPTVEYKEKLKRNKKRLTELAEKKEGYVKRKVAEIEEEREIEEIIQDRIKSLTGAEKKDRRNSLEITVRNHSNLFNYFSKAPLEATCKNLPNQSSFLVKADVHSSENSEVQELPYKSSIENETTRLRKKNIKPNDEASKNLDNLPNKRERDNRKCRWSLRIKLDTCNDKDWSPDGGGSSSDEIFSLHPKDKCGIRSTKKSEGVCSKENEMCSKNDEKRSSGRRKLQLKKKTEKRLSDESKGKCRDDLKDEEIITVDDDGDLEDNNKSKRNVVGDSNSKRKLNEKLAPLFAKRRKPNPETVLARQLFLQPDVTDNDDDSSRNERTKKNNISGNTVLPFPIVSHVTQLTCSSLSVLSSDLNIRRKNEIRYVPVPFDQSSYKSIMNPGEIKQNRKPWPRPAASPTISLIENVENLLAEIETQYSDARKIWDTVSSVLKGRSKDKTKSPKPRPKRKQRKEDASTIKYDNQLVWTEKYKPMSTREIVGNEEAGAKLRNWLNGWRRSRLNENDQGSSGDEFYASDCSSTISNQNNNNNNKNNNDDRNKVAVLLGPHGSGKTACAYAVAQEFGYTVLEVNASSRRTGKKLLKDFEEATKSHRIKKNKAEINLFNSSSVQDQTTENPENSLILLDDIDLIFEEDEGFISATYQLALNTKRPIIMTSRDVCPHLNKMAPYQNRIYFDTVGANSRAFALLKLISFAETGQHISQNLIAQLLESGDLRKALIQLQYLLQHGRPTCPEQSWCEMNFRNSIWDDLRYSLYKPAIKASKLNRKKKKREKEKEKNESSVKPEKTSNLEILNDMSRKLDNVSLLSSLIDIENDEPAKFSSSNVKVASSLSLIEDTGGMYSVSRDISSEIACWIASKIVRKEEEEELHETRNQSQSGRARFKRELNKGVDTALSSTVASLLLDDRIMSVDYLPSIRSICRAEELRLNTISKRGNRFFHYLHSFRASAASLRQNILSTACKIMQDQQ